MKPIRALPVLTAAALAGCSGHRDPPPRADDPVPVPQLASRIAVPIDADARAVARAIDDAIPRTLWTIDRKVDACIAPRRIKLFGKKVKVTPKIGCTITGVVTRGAVTLRGAGQVIVADVPIIATVRAHDVAGILKGETATGRAMAHANIRLSIRPDYTPRGVVKLSYDWTVPPGIDFLGQRITFTDKADEKLAPVIARLEQELPAKLARVNLRSQVEALWRRSFTAVELNERNPPVWMRITPQKLFYDDYAIAGDRLRLNIGMEALTETVVGARPADPAPTPLPPLSHAPAAGRMQFFIPVVADYAQLEPVVLKALVRRSARPFDVPGIGPVNARFDKVVAYGSTGGRIAVGLTLAARAADGGAPRRGMIWFAAVPVNAPGSARVSFTNLTVTGGTGDLAGDLLVRLGNSPGVVDMIADALGQNFTHDLQKLMGKIRRAIDEKRVDDFVIRARMDHMETGRIRAYGRGLYLPVRASGQARISFTPR